MKKLVIVLLVVLLATSVLSYHVRIRWTPWGFVSISGAMITGMPVAKIEAVPSSNPEELANQCRALDAQIMQIFRERKADSIALDQAFIEGCKNVNVPLPQVLTFVTFKKAQEVEEKEKAQQEEEERKKAPPVEIDALPPDDPQQLAAECKRIGELIKNIYREKKGERVAVHPDFIEGCVRVNEPLPAILTIVPFKALVKKQEELKRREEAKRRAQEAEKVQEESKEEAERAKLREQIKAKRAEEARLKAEAEERSRLEARAKQEAEEVQRKAEEEKARREEARRTEQVAPVITTPPAPFIPKGVQREIEPPEKWINEYFKFD